MNLKEYLEFNKQNKIKTYKNMFIGFEVFDNEICLYYHLSKNQSYRNHRSAANRKFYQLSREGKFNGLNNGVFLAQPIEFEFNEARQLCTYKFIKE